MKNKNHVFLNTSEVVIHIPIELLDELIGAFDMFLDGLPTDKDCGPLTKNESKLMGIFREIASCCENLQESMIKEDKK